MKKSHRGFPGWLLSSALKFACYWKGALRGYPSRFWRWWAPATRVISRPRRPPKSRAIDTPEPSRHGMDDPCNQASLALEVSITCAVEVVGCMVMLAAFSFAMIPEWYTSVPSIVKSRIGRAMDLSGPPYPLRGLIKRNLARASSHRVWAGWPMLFRQGLGTAKAGGGAQ